MADHSDTSRQNTTSYAHPQETNLLNVHKAMEYNDSGEPLLRVKVDGGVTITGDLIIDEVDLSAETLAALETVTVLQGTDPWTVDGTVNVGNFPATQTIDGTVTIQDGGNSITIDGNVGITGDVNVTQGTDPWTVDGTVTIQDGGGSVTVDGTVDANITGGDLTVNFGASTIDAFGRLRVSNPLTLFDTQNRYVDGGYFSTDTTGSGSVTYNPNGSNFTMSVTTQGDEVIRQAKRVQLYQPGKSLLVMNTFAFYTSTANIEQRVGYFTSLNGVYLEDVGGTISLVKRSNVTGSVVNTTVNQSAWNGDKMDGTGASGITIDLSKTQILWMDYEWLGVGSVRVGFVINGVFYLAHTFHHANVLSDVYMTTASLNCRYELKSTGVGTSASMLQICSTVISEGGYTPTPPNRTISNGTTTKRLTSANTLYPLATIRLDSAAIDSVVLPSQIEMLAIDVRYGEVKLVENATLTGASFSNNGVSDVVEQDTSATAMSGGTVVYESLFSSRDEISFNDAISRRLQLGREADGTPITLTFAAAATQNNSDLLYKFSWQELSN
jgi:hypothetical protein